MDKKEIYFQRVVPEKFQFLREAAFKIGGELHTTEQANDLLSGYADHSGTLFSAFRVYAGLSSNEKKELFELSHGLLHGRPWDNACGFNLLQLLSFFEDIDATECYVPSGPDVSKEFQQVWDVAPSQIQYLKPTVRRYLHLSNESEIDQAIGDMPLDEIKSLKRVASKIKQNHHFEIASDFINSVDVDFYSGLHQFFLLLDSLDIEFE